MNARWKVLVRVAGPGRQAAESKSQRAATDPSAGAVPRRQGARGKQTLASGDRWRARIVGKGAAELSRTGVQGERDLTETGQEREGSGQMNDDAAHRAHDARAELQQAFPQGADLGAGTGGPGGPQAQFLQRHKGGRP